MLVKVVNRPLKYNGKYHHPGDTVELRRKDARVFIALQRCVEVIAPKKRKIPPPPPTDVITIPDSGAETLEQKDEEDVEISPRTGLPKRKYQRRDMEATD